MKKYMKFIMTLAALLAISNGSWAYGKVKLYGTPQNVSYAISNSETGEFTTITADGVTPSGLTNHTVFLKVTPDAGYSIAQADITVQQTVSGGQANAPRRAPEIGGTISLTETETVHVYSFTMPDDDNVNVLISGDATFDVTILTKISDTTTWTFDQFAKDQQLSNTNVYGYKGLYIKGHNESNYATVKAGTATVTIEGEDISVGKYLYFPGGNTTSTASTVANNPTADRAAFCISVPGTVYVYMKGRYKDGSDRYLIIDVNGTQHKTLITQEDNADVTRLISVDIPMIPEEGANVYIGSSAACDIYAIKFIKKDTYTLTTTINPEEKGEIEVKYSGQEETTTDRTFISGATIEVTAKNTVSGYTFKNWSGADAPTGEDANQATITLTMDADKSLTANYELVQHSLSVSYNNAGGTVKMNDSEEALAADYQGNVGEGTVTLTATPAEGYQFVEWTDQNDQRLTTLNVYTFDLTADTQVKAVFRQPTSPAPAITAETVWTFDSFDAGTVLQFADNVIYEYNGLYISGHSSDKPAEIKKETTALTTGISDDVYNSVFLAGGQGSTLSANRDVTSFTKDAVAFKAGVPGTVYVYMKGGYAEGRNYNINNDGEKLTTPMTDGNPTLISQAVKAGGVFISSDGASTIYAIKFVPDPKFTLTTSVTPEGKGTITYKVEGEDVNTTETEFFKGTTLVLTAATTDSSYGFVKWTDGTNDLVAEEDGTLKVTMSEDKNIVAVFAELPSYEFSATVATDGTGTVTYKVEGSEENSSATTFMQGTRVVLTATPARGYLFDSWKVNDVVDTEHTTNTLTVTINAETTVIATFKPEESVDVTTAWTFGNLETETVYNSISGLNKAYLRGSSSPTRTLTVKALEDTQTLTFADGIEIEVNKYIASNAAASGAGSLTGASTAASSDKDTDSKLLGAGMFAVNTTVPGTLYAKVSSVTENKKIRIYFADGTDIKNQTWTPADTEITEISYTSTAENGGTFFVGGVEAAYNIYAVRFVPTSEVVKYTLTLTQPAAGGTIAATVNGEAVAGSMEVRPGAEVTLTATPTSGYQMGSWKDGNDAAIGAIPQSISTTMTMPTKALTVTAAFTAQPAEVAAIATEKVWTFDGIIEGQKLAGAGTYEYDGLYIGGHSSSNFATVTAGSATSTGISDDVTNYIALPGGYNSDIAAKVTADTYVRDAISFYAGVPGIVSVYMSGTYAEGRTFNIWSGGTKYTTDMPNDNSALLVTQEISTPGAVFMAASAGSNKVYAIKFDPALPQPTLAWKMNTADGKAVYTITSSDDNNIKYQLGDGNAVDAGAKTADVEVSEKTTLKTWSYNDDKESLKVEVTLLATPIVESEGTFDFQMVKDALGSNVNVELETTEVAQTNENISLFGPTIETAATFAGKMAFSELGAAGNLYLRNDKGFLSVKQGQGTLYMAILGVESGKCLTITVDSDNATATTNTGVVTFGQPYEIESADLTNGNLVIKLTDFTGTLNIRNIAITALKLSAPTISVKGLSEDKTKSVYTITYNSKDVLHYKIGEDGIEETPSPAMAGTYDVEISANGTLIAWTTREGVTPSDVTTRDVYVPTASVYADGIYDFTKVTGTTPVEIVTSEQTVGGQAVYAPNAITATTFDRRFAFSTITGTDVRLMGGKGMRVAKGKNIFIALKNLEKGQVFAINYTSTSADDGVIFKSASILDGATAETKVVSSQDYAIKEAGNILIQVSNANASLDITSIKLGSKMKTEQADVEYVVTNGEATVTGFTTGETASVITIPASVEGAPVTSISAGTFTEENTANVTSIDLSETAVTFASGTTRESVDELKNINSATLIYLPSTANVTGTNVVRKTGTGSDATYTCDDYQIEDGKASSVPHAFTAISAKIYREFTADVKCTLCLPYQFTASGGKFYQFTGISDDKVEMTEQTGILDANTPYIFVPNSDATEGASASNVVVSMNDAPETVDAANHFTFKGTYEKTIWNDVSSEGIYGFAANAQDGAEVGQFVRVGAGASIDAYRAYLKYEGEGLLNDVNSPASAPRRALESLPNHMSIRWIPAATSTGITETIRENTKDPRYYNLNGQRVDSHYKGVAIKNGKKVLKK